MCVEHRLDDSHIGATAAEIAAHPFAHALRIVAGLAFLDESDCTHDLARRAEPTLEPVMSDERGLDRMQCVAMRYALDGQHIGAIATQRQGQA